MTKRIGGFKRKTRKKLSKRINQRGKISLTDYLRQFNAGDKVQLKAEPSYHKGMYHPRFHGKTGTVKEKQGKCYKVVIQDFNKEKEIIIHPVHLKRL